MSTEDELLARIQILNDANEALALQLSFRRIARSDPDSLFAKFYSLLGELDFGDLRQNNTSIQTAQAIIESQTKALAASEDEERQTAPRNLGRKPGSTKPSKSAGDSRNMTDWHREIISWAVQHGGIFDVTDYRNNKFVRDYPNLNTDQTRYGSSLNYAYLRKGYLERARPGQYRITEAGRKFAASLGPSATDTHKAKGVGKFAKSA